jgi:DNA-binding ferritin-like protein
MLAELRDDNKQLMANLRDTRGLSDENADVTRVSLLKKRIGEAEIERGRSKAVIGRRRTQRR